MPLYIDNIRLCMQCKRCNINRPRWMFVMVRTCATIGPEPHCSPSRTLHRWFSRFRGHTKNLYERRAHIFIGFIWMAAHAFNWSGECENQCFLFSKWKPKEKDRRDRERERGRLSKLVHFHSGIFVIYFSCIIMVSAIDWINKYSRTTYLFSGNDFWLVFNRFAYWYIEWYRHFCWYESSVNINCRSRLRVQSIRIVNIYTFECRDSRSKEKRTFLSSYVIQFHLSANTNRTHSEKKKHTHTQYISRRQVINCWVKYKTPKSIRFLDEI